MRRVICLCLVIGLFLFGTCPVAQAGSWEPVDGPYNTEAARSLYEWIESNIHATTNDPSQNARDIHVLKNLVRGTLIWAYSYGSTFNKEDFLLHFSKKDEAIQLVPLQNGGVLFVLEDACFKISRDKSSPEGRVYPHDPTDPQSRDRWFASIFNGQAEISFYFSAVGPFLP